MEVFLLNITLIALCILLVDQYGADSPDTKSITNETTGMQIKQKQQVLSPILDETIIINYTFWYFISTAERQHELASTKCDCKKFELTSTGGAKEWQSSKNGKYERQDYLVEGRSVYKHVDKKQHLFWVTKGGGYWMVSRRNSSQGNRIISYISSDFFKYTK